MSHNALMGILPVIMMIVFAAVFVFALLMILSPALRGRMLARQIRSVRYATDLAKDDITRTGENLAGAAIDTLGERDGKKFRKA